MILDNQKNVYIYSVLEELLFYNEVENNNLLNIPTDLKNNYIYIL